MTLALRLLLGDPPLHPSGDDGRDLLRRELLKPEYNDNEILQRIMSWFQRLLQGSNDGGGSPLQTVILMVLLLALAAAAIWLISRVRRAPSAKSSDGPVHTDETITASELRARADKALAAGRTEDALIDGYRALAVRQVESGHLDDLPDATAHEVALGLGATFPDRAARLVTAASHFDAVLYGDRRATADQARSGLALDDDLAVAR